MTSNQKHANSSKSILRAPRKSREFAEVELHLERILYGLARVLVASGIGIAKLNRIARRAYLVAASAISTERGHRTSKARIAALTGLTRTEVSRLSRNLVPASIEEESTENRSQRVTLGWITDPEFLNAQGRPAVLRFSGKRKSFDALVRKYSGDIPARAMLAEMLRLTLVKKVQMDSVRLMRLSSPIPRHAIVTLRAISPLIRFLAESATEVEDQLRIDTKELRLRFASKPQANAAAREMGNRARAFVRSVEELSASGSRGEHELRVSIALAALLPNSRTSSKKSKGKNSWKKQGVDRNPITIFRKLSYSFWSSRCAQELLPTGQKSFRRNVWTKHADTRNIRCGRRSRHPSSW